MSDAKVRVQATLAYLTPQGIGFLTGPEHEIEVRGFVDLRLDDVGEWGEEDPGAFMAKGGIEDLTLRTCTAGDVVLSWNSDKIGLYTDSASEEEDKVVEDEGSVEGSRRATFAPAYPTPEDEDDWGASFRTTELWGKGLEASDTLRDIHLTLSPVSGEAAQDLVNLTVFKVDFKARDGKIYYGFDPKETVWTGGPYAWASVDKDGSSDVPKIEVESDGLANQIEVVVASGESCADINPKTFTAGSTDLTIDGQGEAGNTVVAARFKGTGLTCEKLNIMALPKRIVEVGIYRIEDPTSPGTEFPPSVPTNNQIITTLNDVFQQAVIEFELDESSGVYDVEYDTTKLPWIHEEMRYTPGQDGKLQWREDDAFFEEEPSPWTAEIVVFLVKENGDSLLWVYGYPYQDIPVRGMHRHNPIRHEIVFTDGTAGHTELAVAHEIGHRLGLATKDDGEGHDPGPWPEDEDRLMRSGTPSGPPESPTFPVPGRWLRHEDWNKANEEAGDL